MSEPMRCVEIEGKGGPPDVLRIATRPRPAAAEGEVLIRVEACGVNRPDVLQRQGGYPPPPGASDIPGLEVAGTVAARGANAGAWNVGDRVCALVSGGGYAEYVPAPAPQCLPVPEGLSPIEAAGIPETFFTVWTNVFERGRLVEGETLLVHGGSSGIGTTAIQMASRRGARVFATAGSRDKCAACERRFEDLVRSGDSPACPGCGGKRLKRLLSTFGVGAAKAPSGGGGPCGSCPEGGGGACGMGG
jgi:putative FmdB family regulatory protein